MVLEVDAGSQVEARARDRSDADPGPGSASEEPLLKVQIRIVQQLVTTLRLPLLLEH